MPTIAQLPVATAITGQDEIPLSQAGTTRSVSIGELLSKVQPAILTGTGTLLGRVSLGPGGPESVTVGLGLGLGGAALAATGADHAAFAPQPALTVTDHVVLSSAGSPRLLSVALLRGLFSAGSNVTIDDAGVIASSGGGGGGGAGPAGPQGPAGTAGADGPAGEPGAAGPEGPAGPVINAGSVDAAGNLTLARSDGAIVDVAGVFVGPSGPRGAVGLPGPTGPSGVQGPDGAAGPTGAAGVPGPVGVAGPQGDTGAQGPPGLQGVAGLSGGAGSSINSGTVTPAGALSFLRSDGTVIAVAGAIVGAPGPAGAEGATGLPGPIGATGSAGAVGVPGAVGPQGAAGAAGPQGATGVAGPQGAAGTPGPQGPQGIAGLSGGAGSSINSGTVSPAGALSFLRSDGTVIAVAGTVVGAPGVQGPTGAAGAAGAQGPSGSAGAAGPAINSGAVSPAGALSFERSDGATIAVSGTLVGAPGAAGAAGATGSQGAPGPAGSSVTITTLANATTVAATDLVGISQGGTDHNISFANFLSGETGDQLPAAAPVSATDTFLTLQGGSSTYTQPMSALWAWLSTSQIRTYKRPVIELTGSPASVLMDGTVHNGCDLVCSGAVTIVASGNMGSGFECRIFNVSGSAVTLSGFTTDSGATTIATGFSCSLDVMAYSGGTLYFAKLGGAATIVTPPGQVTGLASGAITYNSVALSWAAPGSGGTPSSYTVGYRVTGAGGAFTALSAAGTFATVTGLSASTGYDFEVTAVNAAGSGAASAITAVGTIAAPTSAPGPVTALAAGTPGGTSVPLSWAAPTSGGAVSTYSVNFRVAGGSAWTAFSSGVTGLSATVTGLSSATGYDFQVVSVNGVGTGSAIVSATTTSPLAAPGQAGAAVASAITATGLTLKWTTPGSGGAVATYSVQSSPTGASTWTSQATGVIGVSVALTTLSANTTYDFRVIAVNATGSGTPSAPVTATTAAYAPGTPAALAIGTAASTSVPLSWAAPAIVAGTSSAAVSYTVGYRVTSVGGTFSQVSGITGTSTTITGLTASTQYDFEVAAVNAGGTSAFTAVVSGTTVSTNYLLTAGYLPTTSSPTGTHGSGSFAFNLNDNSSAAAGSHTIPASVKMGLSSSNTVAPTYLISGSPSNQSGNHYWNASLNLSNDPLPAGTYYWWGLAYDSSSILQSTFVSTGTLTLS